MKGYLIDGGRAFQIVGTENGEKFSFFFAVGQNCRDAQIYRGQMDHVLRGWDFCGRQEERRSVSENLFTMRNF